MNDKKGSFFAHQPALDSPNFLFACLLLIVGTLIAYAPIFSGWYIADDFWHLESFSLPLGAVVKHIIFEHVYLDHADWHYRPLTNFVLMLVCRSHSAFAGHLLNLLVHAATGIALYRFLRQLERGAMAAFTGALLFVLLPAAAGGLLDILHRRPHGRFFRAVRCDSICQDSSDKLAHYGHGRTVCFVALFEGDDGHAAVPVAVPLRFTKNAQRRRSITACPVCCPGGLRHGPDGDGRQPDVNPCQPPAPNGSPRFL